MAKYSTILKKVKEVLEDKEMIETILSDGNLVLNIHTYPTTKPDHQTTARMQGILSGWVRWKILGGHPKSPLRRNEED